MKKLSRNIATKTTTVKTLHAMANNTRMNVINQLLTGEKCVGDLNKVIKISQPALSQHLNKMKNAGILACRRDQRHIYYFINDHKVIRILGILREAA